MEDYILSKGSRILVGMGWGRVCRRYLISIMEVLYLVEAWDF